MIGIYKITSPSKKIYIGQSINIETRFKYYKRLACKSQVKLHASFLKYGVDNHEFEVLQICKREKLNELEIYYINLFQTFNNRNGLNLISGGNVRKMSNETKKKMSASAKGKIISEETKEKMRQARLGKKLSAETKAKISKIHSTEESKNKRRNRVVSIEERKKMSSYGGITHWRCRKVIDTVTKEIFGNCSEAAKSINMKRTTLCMMLTNKNPNKTNFKYYE